MNQNLVSLGHELNALQDLAGVDATQLKQFSLISAVALAVSLPLVSEAAGVNSVNVGRNIKAGTYYNTASGRTVFKAANSRGLWLRSGRTVRGLEVDASGNATGNGGRMHFSAPGGVVRLDGNVDVSALKNGGAYTGNGGRVTVSAAYLYQNGNIYANGVNGGNVSFNVGAATLGPNARIEAMGHGGAGGTINIKAKGAVDVAQGAILDTSGKVIGNVDSNLIAIEGSVVNNNGILRANGVTNADGNGTVGGTIRLDAHGSKDKTPSVIEAINKADDTFTVAESAAIKSRLQNLVASDKGNVVNNGTIQANGGDACALCNTAGDGGIVEVCATDFKNTCEVTANGGNGYASANGGNGGVVHINAYGDIQNDGLIAANGGNGGDAEVCTNLNGGHGGHGGQVILRSLTNPTGTGLVQAKGGNGGVADGVAYSGNGGNGGTIMIKDPNNLQVAVDVSGGQGGVAGSPCGYAGTPGAPGQVVESPDPEVCDVPPPPPPPETPEDPEDPRDPTVPPFIPPVVIVPPQDNPPLQVIPQIQYPETALRMRLEQEIAQANQPVFSEAVIVNKPPAFKNATKNKKPTVRRRTKVRGFW